jgi:fused signal recognition particle receptor
LFEKLRGALDTAITKATTKELSEKNLADAVWDLQMVLIQNDVAVEVAEHICELTKEKVLGKKDKGDATTILFVGVNGTGKTTTLAKLAHLFKNSGFSIVIAAGDTFRAGSIEQLEKHAERLEIRVIKQDYGSDAAAIAFDAVAHAKARHIDIVLIDSAGRMQSNKNLLEEMKKIVRVAEPDLKIFVGDALAGNDVLSQAKEFHKAIGIDGAILTKVDADPSGGAALSIAFVTGRPVVYVGIGQNYDDIERFDSDWFAKRLIAEN